MRVISGDKRGRRLKEPRGMETRPTTDQVKEAMFSILQFELEGKEVLDLFAGTGQLGIEALSRGAKRAVFCEESPAALKIIGENLKICGLEDRARVCRGDALRLLPGLGSFDIILIDPPYASDYYEKCLKTIIEIDNLRENGIIILESLKERVLPSLPPPYEKGREYVYGRKKLSIFRRKELDA